LSRLERDPWKSFCIPKPWSCKQIKDMSSAQLLNYHNEEAETNRGLGQWNEQIADKWKRKTDIF
jgi:hypothetical protein